MQIARIGQSSFSGLLSVSHDLALVASGYESRARELASRLTDSEAAVGRRIAWGFEEHADNAVRKINDGAFAKWGFESCLMREADATTAAKCFTDELSRLPEGKIE